MCFVLHCQLFLGFRGGCGFETGSLGFHQEQSRGADKTGRGQRGHGSSRSDLINEGGGGYKKKHLRKGMYDKRIFN